MRINRVVTKVGDGGQTQLVGGQMVPKSALRVAAYGDVDELNSCLGLAAAHVEDRQLLEHLHHLQHELFTVGADLASPPKLKVPRVGKKHVEELEKRMESLMDDLPPLEEFILPGGGPGGAALHLARTIARRAERSVVALMAIDKVTPEVQIYLNRLSDFLFVLARVANRRAGQPETLAEFSKKRSRREPES